MYVGLLIYYDVNNILDRLQIGLWYFVDDLLCWTFAKDAYFYHVFIYHICFSFDIINMEHFSVKA